MENQEKRKSIAKKKTPQKQSRGPATPTWIGVVNFLIVDRRVGRNRFVRARARVRRFPVVVDMVFYFSLYIIFSILEFADTSSQPTHQFGNLFTSEHQEQNYRDDDNMRTTE